MLSFAIFKLCNGTISWLQSAANLTDARARMNSIAASKPGGYTIVDYKKKRIFLIDYGSLGFNARVRLLRRFGHHVRGALGNQAAIAALRSIRKVDLFVVGCKAPEHTRREMIAWLRLHYPNAKIVSLNPGNRCIANADYNVTTNKYESVSLAAAAAAS
jgi:hypothetical protein